MFTKLNRVLLASGLAVASAAMLSPAVFAQVITPNGTTGASGALDGEILPLLTLAWVGSGNTSFTIPTAGIANVPLGTVAATGNVAYRIVGSSAKNGVLGGATTPADTIAYTLKLGGGAVLNPTTADFTVFTSVLTASLPATALTLDIAAGVITTQSPQHYTDTLTLTTVSP